MTNIIIDEDYWRKFETMKSSILYYLVITVPFVVLVYFVRLHKINSGLFTVLLLTYVFIYRSITDYLRLLSRNIISRKDFWRTYMPSSRIKYFKALYFPWYRGGINIYYHGWTLKAFGQHFWLCKNHRTASSRWRLISSKHSILIVTRFRSKLESHNIFQNAAVAHPLNVSEIATKKNGSYNFRYSFKDRVRHIFTYAAVNKRKLFFLVHRDRQIRWPCQGGNFCHSSFYC